MKGDIVWKILAVLTLFGEFLAMIYLIVRSYTLHTIL